MVDLDDLRFPIGRFSPPAASLPGIQPDGIALHIGSQILNPRPFISAPRYFGPDRRRKTLPNYGGPLRRASDTPSVIEL